eukprot:14064983-Alexandrium_andersonii.AAC.1
MTTGVVRRRRRLRRHRSRVRLRHPTRRDRVLFRCAVREAEWRIARAHSRWVATSRWRLRTTP